MFACVNVWIPVQCADLCCRELILSFFVGFKWNVSMLETILLPISPSNDGMWEICRTCFGQKETEICCAHTGLSSVLFERGEALSTRNLDFALQNVYRGDESFFFYEEFLEYVNSLSIFIQICNVYFNKVFISTNASVTCHKAEHAVV